MALAEYLDCELDLANFDQATLSVAGSGRHAGRPALGGEELKGRLLEASDPTRYGTLLFTALFDADPGLRAGYRGALAIARHDHKRLRLRLHIDAFAPPRLHDWRWELLYDPLEQIAFGRSQDIAFSRYLSVPRKPPPAHIGRPRMLVVICSPEDLADYPLPELDRDGMQASLEEALKPLRKQLSWEFLEGPVTAGRIGERLADEKYHILHLQAHGLVQGGSAGLVLETEDRVASILEQDLLAELVARRGLRLVTLMACHGGARAGTDPFSGLAPALVRRGIPAVVAGQRRIFADDAARFSRHFYRHLAREGVVDVAANEARWHLHLVDPVGSDWATPALFMCPEDGRLWHSETAVPKPARRRQAAPSGRRIPELLPFMPNRKRHEDRLSGALARQRQRPARPLVCLVIGDDRQALDMFERRLVEVCLPRKLALDPTTGVTDHPLRLPPGLETRRELRRRLRLDLCEKFLNAPDGSEEGINRVLVGIHRPVLIHAHLLAEECKRPAALARGFLDFWRDWPDLSPGQMLIVGLFIEYEYEPRIATGPRRFLSWWSSERRVHGIRKVFEDYESANPGRLTCSVLPRLEGITRTEAESWAREEEPRHFCQSHVLIREIRALFRDWRSKMSSETIPMEDLAAMLEQALTRNMLMESQV